MRHLLRLALGMAMIGAFITLVMMLFLVMKAVAVYFGWRLESFVAICTITGTTLALAYLFGLCVVDD